MAGLLKDPQLELLAIQLNSIRENQPKRLFARLAYRLRRNFWRRSYKEKAIFLKYALGWTARNVHKWLAGAWASKVARQSFPGQSGLRVAAVCHGGLGDLVIYSAFLECFYRACHGPTIHVVLDPLRIKEGEFVFHHSPAVQGIKAMASLETLAAHYDVVLKIGDLLSYEFIHEERVGQVNPQVLQRLKTGRRQQRKVKSFIDSMPFADGLFATAATRSGLRRLDVLGQLANVPFTQEHQLYLSPDPDACGCLSRLGLLGRPTITIHNGWDNVAHRQADKVTKVWPQEHYCQFVERFKKQFPDVLIVQLGAKTSRPIANVDLCLCNKTTLHEAAWILKHSLLHVDGDSGLVHMARALHTRSLVLFGPTNHEFFAYRQNLKLFSTICNNCWWTTPDWMRSCPRGLNKPECMDSLAPEKVCDLAAEQLHSLPSWDLAVESVSPKQGLEFIREKMGSARGKYHRLALVGDSGPLLREMPELVPDNAVFDYSPGLDEASPIQDGSSKPFGSFLNLPAENEAFDLVVSPFLLERTAFPSLALKEALRLLTDGGNLLLTFGEGQGEIMAQSFDDLGIAAAKVGPGAGGMVLRKTAGGKMFSGFQRQAS